MKEFFKMVGATVVGLFAFFIVTTALIIMSLIGMVASMDNTKSVPDDAVLVLNLNGVLEERTAKDNFLSNIMSGNNNSISLEETVDAIKYAQRNENVKAIYMECGNFAASYASLKEIRDELENFKKSGKKIISYADSYTQGTYYLASVSNKILINKIGSLDWRGIASAPMFLKNLLDKVGVKMQLVKVGTYKSAPEMFTADKMSDANRLQITEYINGIWTDVCNDVSKSRKISVQQLNTLADNCITLSPTDVYIKNKLVDKAVYTDEIKAEVNKLLGFKEDEEINKVGVNDLYEPLSPDDSEGTIAVYYAFGDIVDNEAQGMLRGSHNIVGNKVCKDLKDIEEDEDVKAVVIRVNSGGGSAYASEQIWHQIMQLKAKKPVVISMGDYAASGGYYISSAANYIVAQPQTLTGSIGIFGMFPEVSNLLTNKLGVNIEEIKTNKHGNFMTMYRPINADEQQVLQAYIDKGYDLFLTRVADGRKMTKEQVNKIAQGRVWTGRNAKNIKLVDALGGLNLAVEKAASLARIEEYDISSYPTEESSWKSFMNKDESGSYIDEKLKTTLGELYTPIFMIKNITNQNKIQARIPFIINAN